MNERASHVFISKRTVEIGIPTNFKLQNSGVGGGGGGVEDVTIRGGVSVRKRSIFQGGGG